MAEPGYDGNAVRPPRRARVRVVRNGIGIGIATGALGLSFGAIATATGLSTLQACALSLLLFSGASQFALVSVLGAGGGALSAAGSALLLGSRNGFYGLRLSSLLDLKGDRRLFAAQLVIDESTAMALAETDPRLARLGFWATGLSVYVLWNAGTLLGAVAGELVSDPRTFGLDAAGPAVFIALLGPRLTSRFHWLMGLIAAGVALSVTPYVPAGVAILAAAGVAVLLAPMQRDDPLQQPELREPRA